jgi:hypothetical protein
MQILVITHAESATKRRSESGKKSNESLSLYALKSGASDLRLVMKSCVQNAILQETNSDIAADPQVDNSIRLARGRMFATNPAETSNETALAARNERRKSYENVTEFSKPCHTKKGMTSKAM